MMENENYLTEPIESNGSSSWQYGNTPWKSDEEIYEYASHRRYELGWEWNVIKYDLVKMGLDEAYADAIIENLISTYGYSNPSLNSYFVENGIDNRGMFKRPFSFQGRIRRTEFGLSLIIYYAVIYGGAFFIGFLAGATGAEEILVLLYLLFIPCVWFLWAQSAKRCHDLGHSGWYQLIPFYIFWLLFASGDPDNNEYGNNPKS